MFPADLFILDDETYDEVTLECHYNANNNSCGWTWRRPEGSDPEGDAPDGLPVTQDLPLCEGRCEADPVGVVGLRMDWDGEVSSRKGGPAWARLPFFFYVPPNCREALAPG